MRKHHLLGAALFLGLSVFGQTIPRPAIDLSARSLDGKALTLREFKGKNVLLAFLLTT